MDHLLHQVSFIKFTMKYVLIEQFGTVHNWIVTFSINLVKVREIWMRTKLKWSTFGKDVVSVYPFPRPHSYGSLWHWVCPFFFGKDVVNAVAFWTADYYVKEALHVFCLLEMHTVFFFWSCEAEDGVWRIWLSWYSFEFVFLSSYNFWLGPFHIVCFFPFLSMCGSQ